MRKTFWLLFLFTACNNQNEIQHKLVNAYNNLNENEYIQIVLDLDAENPGNFYINVDLGYIYLLNSDYENAEKSFDIAEKNRKKRDRDWNYKLYSGLADLRYYQSNWISTIEVGKKALEMNTTDPGVIKLTLAKASSNLHNSQESFKYYKEAYLEHPGFLDHSDWNRLSELAILYKDFSFTYSLWMNYWKMFGYEPGLGLRISVLSGKLGNQEESILSGFIDLDFQRAFGLIQKHEQDGFISKVREFDISEDILDGLTFYADSNWSAAEKSFSSLKGDFLVLTFLRLSSLIEQDLATQEDIDNYLTLQPYFYKHPLFYHRLLISGKEIAGYNKIELMEQAIVYSKVNLSLQYRNDLGKAIGLKDNFITHFLIPLEIKNINSEYKINGDLQKLRPLIHFLNIPYVYSTNEAITVLTTLAKDTKVRKFLTLIEKNAEGILDARLKVILAK